ncbi:hypothetical protein J699_00363 [Acinetobacter sp. 1000160]|nr:hypothetical protein J699_00363 [Acinetobacter sp. 1000160]
MTAWCHPDEDSLTFHSYMNEEKKMEHVNLDGGKSPPI